MHRSDELSEVSFELFRQFQNLGQTSAQMSIGIFNEPEDVLALYSTLYGSQWSKPVNISLQEPVVINKIFNGWKQKEKSIVIDISGEDLARYNAYRKKISNIMSNDGSFMALIFQKACLHFLLATLKLRRRSIYSKDLRSYLIRPIPGFLTCKKQKHRQYRRKQI